MGITKRLFLGFLGVFVVGLVVGLWGDMGAGSRALAHNDGGGDKSRRNGRPPTDAQIAFATRTSDLLLNTLFAALTQEFNETTAANVEEGKTSISLVFNDGNEDMRLVGTRGPLRENDRPRDAFERAALALALAGQNHTAVERDDNRWVFRRSVALSNFRAECSLCHDNFPAGPSADWVGALMLRVPIP